MSKKIYLDLDGTVYNLYKIENWLSMLRNEESGVFNQNQFIGNYNEFLKEVYRLIGSGWSFGVITWLPMGASPEYEQICREEKEQWINENLPFVNEVNICFYGIPKQNLIQKRAKTMVLIDDNIEVCKMWNTNKMRKSINVSKDFDIIAALKTIEQGRFL